ncbi:GlxA family transcriptional regulator [Modestobacter versicolor]|uniref:AraC family transcriptional regulator n=1 Tax=Modestobacter versicolor TaxID=429133 RepID=A0A323VAP2_9ACTN|nr:helix-turn-helix domain-containing protein [Modestobacter versicolor]MBB3674741.1 transcriptional regulator GlxA family with amidase domain [Modestobacter versicolor]PZA21103.1 AraC family transcriptional regulator [Modestobacter versicolor]
MPHGSCQPADAPISVVLIVDENSNPFEVGCACEVFGARRRADLGRELYDLRVVAPSGSTTMRDGLFTLTGTGDLAVVEEAHTVVVPNRPDVDSAASAAVLDAVRRAHARGARLVGLCTGAFTLAEAGVLDGRPAAVHWQLVDEFRRRFPAVEVRPDVLFVDDGDVLTSAGSAAALDLALHVVRRDHGAEAATSVARRLVFAAFRDGGQQQFVERPVPAVVERPLTATLAWAQGRLDSPLTVADLARQAHTSVTTLHRWFRAELGTTPLAWLTGERVDLARRLLEGGELTLDAVAHRSGLGSTANLRTQLRRHTGLSPTEYRTRFAAT